MTPLDGVYGMREYNDLKGGSEFKDGEKSEAILMQRGDRMRAGSSRI